jgi:gliding motility-associated lipoprotein GldH
MKNFIKLSVIITVLISCQSNNIVFEENQELSPGLEWITKETKTFKFDLKDSKATYKSSLLFRFTEGFQYKSFKVKVTQISPSNKEITTIINLKIINENGEYIGEPALEIWDSEHVISNNLIFTEAGSYTYRIESLFPSERLPSAMEIGLRIEKN